MRGRCWIRCEFSSDWVPVRARVNRGQPRRPRIARGIARVDAACDHSDSRMLDFSEDDDCEMRGSRVVGSGSGERIASNGWWTINYGAAQRIVRRTRSCPIYLSYSEFRHRGHSEKRAPVKLGLTCGMPGTNAKPRNKLKPQLGLKPHLPHLATTHDYNSTRTYSPRYASQSERPRQRSRPAAYLCLPPCSARLQTPPGASQPTSRAHFTSQASLAPMGAPPSSKSGPKVSSTNSCIGQPAIRAQSAFGFNTDNRHTGRYLFIH